MIDLHTHTTVSDGSASPAELIQAAKNAGLRAVAITDHDSIDGLEEARSEADLLGMKLIRGIEFSVSFGKKRLIHILGLGIEPGCEGFMQIYSRYRQIRSERLLLVLGRLSTLNIHIRPDELDPYTSGGYRDRQAVAKYLVAEGYASSMKIAWSDILDPIDYFEGELITPEDAFSAIHAAGGKAFLAHFHLPIGLKGYSDEEAFKLLAELKELGLDGMESYYPSFSEEDILRCTRFIETFDFLGSGGTDYHGANRPHIKLGRGEGDFEVPDELLENIIPCVPV